MLFGKGISMGKTKQNNYWKKQFTTVTLLSKTIALILFILLPFIGFYIGMQYQKTLDSLTPTQPVLMQAPTK